MSDPHLPDKCYPYRADQTSYILLKPSTQIQRRDGIPVPPQELRLGMPLAATIELFLSSGKIHVDKMKRILLSSGFRIQDGARILELGCSSGRMIRWLEDLSERCEIWGVDISAVHIIWCQQNLSPPFNFAAVTTSPHLPFEDSQFDLIYSGSVFTHIADLADAWLLELKRIARPGGKLYVTVHDRHSADLIMNHPEKNAWLRNLLLSYNKKENFGSRNFAMFTMFRGAESQVFYDIDFLRQHWGRFLNVLSITPEAYSYQTALVLEK